jgi:hypothetical protein
MAASVNAKRFEYDPDTDTLEALGLDMMRLESHTSLL